MAQDKKKTQNKQDALQQAEIKYNTHTDDEATQRTQKSQMYAPRPVTKREKPKSLPRSTKK